MSENLVDSLQSVPVIVNFDESDSIKGPKTAEDSSSQEMNCQENKSDQTPNTENSKDHESSKPDTENSKPPSETQGITYKTEMIIKNVHKTISPEKSTTTAMDVEESHVN